MRELTKPQRDFLERIRDGRRLKLADREEDRARQFCRREGLAEVVMNPRRWRLTDSGLALLRSHEEGDS